EGGGRGLQFAALVEQLDPPLRLFEPCVAEAGELDAALVERQRLLEGEVAVLELLHDRFELGDGGLEVFNGRVGHRTFYSSFASVERTSHFSWPRSSLTRTVSPGATVDASRRMRVRPSSQATA